MPTCDSNQWELQLLRAGKVQATSTTSKSAMNNSSVWMPWISAFWLIVPSFPALPKISSQHILMTFLHICCHMSHVSLLQCPLWKITSSFPGPAQGSPASSSTSPRAWRLTVWTVWTVRGDGWNNNLRIDGFMHLGFYELLEANRHVGEICGFETSSDNI